MLWKKKNGSILMKWIKRLANEWMIITDRNWIFSLDSWSFGLVWVPSLQLLQHYTQILQRLFQAPFLKYFHTFRCEIRFLAPNDMLVEVVLLNYAKRFFIRLFIPIRRFHLLLIQSCSLHPENGQFNIPAEQFDRIELWIPKPT